MTLKRHEFVLHLGIQFSVLTHTRVPVSYVPFLATSSRDMLCYYEHKVALVKSGCVVN